MSTVHKIIHEVRMLVEEKMAEKVKNVFWFSDVTVIAPVTPNSRAANVSSTSPISPAVVGLSMVLVVVFIAIGIAVFLKYRDKAYVNISFRLYKYFII